MSDWLVGLAIGIVVGWVIGFTSGRRQSSWVELTERERRLLIALIALGVAALLAGIIVFVLVD